MENDFYLTVQSSDLLSLISLSNSIIEKRNTIAILNNFRLEAENGELIITATDMNLSVVQSMGAQIKFPGIITASSQILSEIIKKISDTNLTLCRKKELLEISTTNCIFNLPIISANQFPEIIHLQQSSDISILAKDLISILEYTKFSISNEETRYTLNGVYLQSVNNKITAASTDGHRLSVSSVQQKKKIEDFNIIIPKKALLEIIKIFSNLKYMNDLIILNISTNTLQIKSDKICLTSKLIDGKFPDYENFVPKQNNNILRIQKSKFASAIDRVDIVSMDRLRSVKIDISSNCIGISAYHESNGKAEENIMLHPGEYEGESIIISFNPKYLLDIFSAIREENIDIYLKDSVSPILIKASKESFFVVMPIKL